MPGSAFRTTARVKEDDLLRYPSLGLCVQIGPHATVTEPTDPASNLDGTQFSVLTRMGLHQVQELQAYIATITFFFYFVSFSFCGHSPEYPTTLKSCKLLSPALDDNNDGFSTTWIIITG